MSRRKTMNIDPFDESAVMNNASFRYYADRLAELSISMFDWKNLPETVDPRFLELALFTDGKAVFFEDDDIGFLCLRCAASGKLDCYNIPTRRRGFGTGYQSRELDTSNSVIIYNNMLHTNTYPVALLYAKRLYSYDAVIDININAQKTPVAIIADEKQRLTMLNLYQKYDGGQPYIFADKNLNLNDIRAINTGAPWVASNIYAVKNSIWNEALTYLGISNVNSLKKERLLTDEVQKNSAGVVASRYSRLRERMKAVDKINDLFGLNISVEFAPDNDITELTGIEAVEDFSTQYGGGNE